MKKGIVLCLLFALPLFVLSQNCVPNPMYQDSTVGVFPPPVSDINPDGGIDVVACNNMPYEFIFTVIIQDSIAVPFGADTLVVSLASASITDISGLPNGLSYACEPGDCTINANTSGCLIIQGTPDDTPGEYPLVIFAKMVTSLGTIDISFPGSFFPGSYTLTLAENGSADCGSTAVEFSQSAQQDLRISPNPAYNQINIALDQGSFHDASYEIIDINGKKQIDGVIANQISNHNINIDALSNGSYFLRVQTNKGMITKRFSKLK